MDKVKIEIIIYAVITKAKPEMPHNAINVIKRIISNSCLSLPLSLIFLNFRENIGISEIINQENINIKRIVIYKKVSLIRFILFKL